MRDNSDDDGDDDDGDGDGDGDDGDNGDYDGYCQALIDVVEQLLDQSVPGWRDDIDRQAIQSGSEDTLILIMIVTVTRNLYI